MTETSVFSNLLKKTSVDKTLPTRMKEARLWVQQHATSSMKNAKTIIRSAPSTTTRTDASESIIGQMILFQYEATTAKNLPYWDRFPLVFPFETTRDGIYGINLHYLPLPLRARLMDSLMSVADQPNISNTTKLNLTYKVIQSASRSQFFQPCVKRYLNKGLASKFVVIPATEWNIALFLPLERFQKASINKVHQDSLRIIRGQ